MSIDGVLTALADPTRRRIVEIVAAGERTAGQLAAEFSISRPSVSRHLRVLRDAGLLTCRGEAQRRIYRLERKVLDEARDWIEHTRARCAGPDDDRDDRNGGCRGRAAPGSTQLSQATPSSSRSRSVE